MVDNLTEIELDNIFKRFEKAINVDELATTKSSRDARSLAKKVSSSKNIPIALAKEMRRRSKILIKIRDKVRVPFFFPFKNGKFKLGTAKINTAGEQVFHKQGVNWGRDIKTGRFTSLK